MNLLTLPYYRFFRQNTLLPIKALVKSYEHSGDSANTHRMFSAWQDRKLIELHFVQVAVRDNPLNVSNVPIPCTYPIVLITPSRLLFSPVR